MLKNACFLEKNVKIVSASGAPPLNARLIPAYYYNFVEFVFSAKCTVIPLTKEPSNYCKCSTFASSALLHLIFNSNSLSFVERGRKNISCSRAQGTLATPLLSSFRLCAHQLIIINCH